MLPATSDHCTRCSRCYKPTISSLHIGHTSLLDALAAAFSVGPIRTLLLMSSLVSAVLAGLMDVCELSDTELSEGDSRLALRRWTAAAGCGGGAAGDRFLPLPSTRPPPRDLREVIFGSVLWSRECTWARMGRLEWVLGAPAVARDAKGALQDHMPASWKRVPLRGRTMETLLVAGNQALRDLVSTSNGMR
jgi:hypothetical protein